MNDNVNKDINLRKRKPNQLIVEKYKYTSKIHHHQAETLKDRNREEPFNLAVKLELAKALQILDRRDQYLKDMEEEMFWLGSDDEGDGRVKCFIKMTNWEADSSGSELGSDYLDEQGEDKDSFLLSPSEEDEYC